ncbi:MAG: WYL domain-containing protein [Holophagaceae bacterium]|nr:WYL domain-containing protein [Holophagaceae bacterium]
MATVKKTTTLDSKPKAVPEKTSLKPDAAAPKKAAGAPKKPSVAAKKAPGKGASAAPKAKPSAESDVHLEPSKEPLGPTKSTLKIAAEKPNAKPEISREPLAAIAPSGPTADASSTAVKTTSSPAAPAASAPKPAVKPLGISSWQSEAALQAVREGRAIELIFSDSEANPPRTFEPRQLIFDTLTQAWFVWGWDRRYNAERHHRLDQMAEINLVEGPGRSAQGPYKEGTPANLIGGWLGGEPIPVKATLQKQWIFAVKQAPPAFPEFKIEDGEEGKATVSFVATDLRAIARWCLQFGEGIQVLEPQRLVDRIKQVGIAWVGKPVAAAPAPAPRPAAQPAPRPEFKPEHKPEYKSEHRREHSKDREEAPKKGSRIEIRVEKL